MGPAPKPLTRYERRPIGLSISFPLLCLGELKTKNALGFSYKASLKASVSIVQWCLFFRLKINMCLFFDMNVVLTALIPIVPGNGYNKFQYKCYHAIYMCTLNIMCHNILDEC